ncbi:hypothetical protein [uncultured Chitinophaga sp.]|jgi:hypothetical protein|uniref:hypothetical protein n=1 Tax=uncultured Chitinophaga sp. TaxID=339340 RepID=UPI002607F399|nr:hypothetical protein [uncultured Chitinophaga sp.]
MEELIKIISACLTPVVAIGAVAVSVSNYKLGVKKRRDELFDRRYKFYKDFEEYWKTTGAESEGATRMEMEWEDIAAFEQEANFLFGPDIAKHIRSYEGKSFRGIRWVPDLELAKPFKKYLDFR